MTGLTAVLSREQILDQVVSNKGYYNNAQNVEDPKIEAIFSTSDEQLLAQIGYKPELKRHFSTIQAFGVAFSIMGLLPSIASILAQGIIAGPAGFLWGWVISSLLILTIAISMSENGSSIPTSGGLYYWTNYYSPPKYKTVISYLIGNTNSIALIGALCSVDYGFALELLSVVVIAKDGDFEITAAKTYGVFVGCVLLHILITCLSSKNCAYLQTTSIIVNVFIIVLYIIALPIGARGNFKSAKYVFTEFDNISDWPMGWTQLSAAWLPAIWTIGAFDSVIHVSEEVKDAEHTIPIGILGSVIACGSLGTIILIVTFFCIQTDDIEGHILGTKFGQPMAQIIFDCLGKKWALTFMALIAFAQFLMGASILTAISRQIWAFARDNGLPFSRWIKKVNVELSVPINAVWFGGIVAILIGLLVLIGSVAANALFTLYIAGNYVAWGTPTFLRLTTGREKFRPGKFWLGPIFSPLIGWISTIFIAYTFVMVMLPASRNPTKDNMNYTCVITPSVWILSLIYYYVYAHKNYHGPCKTVDTVDEEEQGLDAILDGIDPNADSDKSSTNEKVIEKV
ncbi:GABA-specific high-affinity permease [Scheffersomyces xylosifermentans]|uniref:GABA-specific high-affinity permease n=1 Tax=Scheffersomyces xylosifermentans TaxID=1304137 RepID=UPI00315D7AEB